MSGKGITTHAYRACLRGVVRRVMLQVPLLAIFGALPMPDAVAALITGTTSPYYLSNYADKTFYVIQGTEVIDTFAWTTGLAGSGFFNGEGIVVVTDTVRTRSFRPNSPGGAEYSLQGAPTGITYVNPMPPGLRYEELFDATSDGQYNYYVQHYGITNNGLATENVYRTDLDWSDPTPLFSLQTVPGGSAGEFLGITYDSGNQSLWIGGWNLNNQIRNYSLSGTLLSQFSTVGQVGSLALDPADGTLWMTRDHTALLFQYARDGTLLQSGTVAGLPQFGFLSGEFARTSVPEPAPLALLGLGAVCAAGFGRRRLVQKSTPLEKPVYLPGVG